jgi:hypothetical protein
MKELLMGLIVKASDLYYRYPKDTVNRRLPKFSGKPDKRPFNRDDLYEVLPLLGAVMDSLGSDEQRILHQAEELMIRDLPRFLTTREEVFDFLVGCMGDLLERA